MMRKYRGIVCEKKASYTVFLTENGEFLRGVPLIADVQIGEEAAFHLFASTTSKRRMKPIFIAPALIAAVLLLFLVASWFPKATPAYAYIQVEGDSTIEIGVDENGKVISLQSSTETMSDWKGQPMDLVLAKAVEQISTDKNELAVTTVYEKEDKPKLKKQIEKAVQEVNKQPLPQKNSIEPEPKNTKPKEENAKPPGQIKKEEKLPNPNIPATKTEPKNSPIEKPVKNTETTDNSNENKAQPKENKPKNNSNKVPGQEKKKNEDKSNNGNNANKNNGNNKNSNN
ncbi:anti-sigma factor domain-containing protein [Psychrobacillus sp. FSL H8-0510]|uniref:anti-sigma factor domain-containing protein n=1 Tax=Psychrobacillus sp. FSL H8-0510 TaxID=2921394 RepID=UPI0030F51698